MHCLDIRQDLLDSLDVALVDQVRFAQVPLSLGGLLGEDMAAVSLAANNLAGTGYLEPLGSPSVRFHLRHCLELLSLFANIMSFYIDAGGQAFGATNMTICRPSILGSWTTMQSSASASLIFFNTSIPWLWA